MFAGLYVALVTPFTRSGELNETKLRELVRFHAAAGTDGLVPCGTTGEGPALRGWEERERILRIVVEETRGKMKVIAGVGTNSTAETIRNVQRLEPLGVDGALVITPYYNKPTPAGLEAHFRAVAAASPVPLVLYNVPGRTGVNLLPETIAALADVPRIVAVKEASGNLVQASWIHRRCGERIAVLCGEDALTYPMLCLGATGVISVLGNVVPGDMLAMIAAHRAGDARTARDLHLRLLPLAEALFLETNPMPVKAALNQLGFEVGDPRLPLVPMRAELAVRLGRELEAYGVERAPGC
ncbi:MAG: 4-hydroxy-tetrahydrodipicolinate synthase [Proteobacteria bacterium]|nr:4-hydroxy-tetrahydrodipicolinate synthase [Pseudomonadota bacterium]